MNLYNLDNGHEPNINNQTSECKTMLSSNSHVASGC